MFGVRDCAGLSETDCSDGDVPGLGVDVSTGISLSGVASSPLMEMPSSDTLLPFSSHVPFVPLSSRHFSAKKDSITFMVLKS